MTDTTHSHDSNRPTCPTCSRPLDDQQLMQAECSDAPDCACVDDGPQDD